MDNAAVLKALGILLVLLWILPVLRIVMREVWAVADPNPAEDEESASARAERAALWDSGGVEGSELSNNRWGTGRPEVRRRPTGFGRDRS